MLEQRPEATQAGAPPTSDTGVSSRDKSALRGLSFAEQTALLDPNVPPRQGGRRAPPDDAPAVASKPKPKRGAAKDPWADHQPVLSQPGNLVIRVGDTIDLEVEDTAYDAKRAAVARQGTVDEPDYQWRLVADHDAWKPGAAVSIADLWRRSFGLAAARPGLTGLRVLTTMTTPGGATRRASTGLVHAEIADEDGKRPSARAPGTPEVTDSETAAEVMQAVVKILDEDAVPKHYPQLAAHGVLLDAWWRVMSREARADGKRLIGAPYVATTLTKALAYAAGLTVPIHGALDRERHADLRAAYAEKLTEVHERAAKVDAETDVASEIDAAVGGTSLEGLDERQQLGVTAGKALGTLTDAMQGINDGIGTMTEATALGEVVKTLDLSPDSAAAKMAIKAGTFGGMFEHVTAIITAVNAYADGGELAVLDPVARKAGLSAPDYVSAIKAATELLAGATAVMGATLYVVAQARGASQAAAAALGFVTKGLANFGHICNVLGGIKGGFTLLDAKASTSDKVKAGVDITVGLSSVATIGAEIVGKRAGAAAATASGELAATYLGREAAAAGFGLAVGSAIAAVQITYVSVNGVLEQGIAAYEGLMWAGMQPVFESLRTRALDVHAHLERLVVASAMLDDEEDPVRREVLSASVRALEANLRLYLELLLAHMLKANDNQRAGFYPPLAKRFAGLAGKKLEPRAALVGTASAALVEASKALVDIRPLFVACAEWVWANHGVALW